MRFAPAPTGFVHVGSARTALFNWLFARHTGGTFILRIEDTDPERSRDDLVEGITRSLHWLGLDWDEGPYRQSARMDLYRQATESLRSQGAAYLCDCTRDAIDARTRARPGATPGYDGFCRERSVSPGVGVALRFRTPDEGVTVVHDLIRGDVPFEHTDLEDFVIRRGDGSPTFLVANAVDDADMGITHVVRGEDLLPSTPRILLLRGALELGEDPAFAHLPLLVNEKRQKLSKRRDDVALEEFRERGYLPEAMRNYLALLGWAPSGDREIMPVSEMAAEFRLEDVKSSPAFFDVQKLDAINAEYIRALPVATFVRESLPWLETEPPWPPECFDLARFEVMAPLVQERVRTLAEVAGMVDFLYLEEPVVDPAAWEKAMVRFEPAAAIVADALNQYTGCQWDAPTLHDVTLAIGESHGVKLGKAQAPIRVAITGRSVGPPLFESLAALGRERTLSRLRTALDRVTPGSSEDQPSRLPDDVDPGVPRPEPAG